MAEYRFPVVGYPKSVIPLHWGTSPNAADLFAPRGTSIQAMVNGKVTYVGNDSLGGHNVMMQGDPDTKSLWYYMAHMDQVPLVKTGQRVTAGQQIGVVGDSGNAAGKGTHLHIGIGTQILDGAGPEGGAGTPWPGNNCNRYLQHILDTIGSGGGVTPPPPPPPPPPVNYETIARYLTDPKGPVLTALIDRRKALIETASALTTQANELLNVINEIERNRPS